MAFVASCSQTDKYEKDFIESHPELITVYNTLDQTIIPYYTHQGKLTVQTATEAFDGILYREVYDFGYSPFCVNALTEGKIKSTINNYFRSTSARASFGYTNIKPTTMNADIYQRLPEEYQKAIYFDNERSHVDPSSLSTFLSQGGLDEQIIHGLWCSGSIISSYNDILFQSFNTHGYNDKEKGFILETCYAGGDEWIKFFKNDNRKKWLRDPLNYHYYDRRNPNRFNS